MGSENVPVRENLRCCANDELIPVTFIPLVNPFKARGRHGERESAVAQIVRVASISEQQRGRGPTG